MDTQFANKSSLFSSLRRLCVCVCFSHFYSFPLPFAMFFRDSFRFVGVGRTVRRSVGRSVGCMIFGIIWSFWIKLPVKFFLIYFLFLAFAFHFGATTAHSVYVVYLDECGVYGIHSLDDDKTPLYRFDPTEGMKKWIFIVARKKISTFGRQFRAVVAGV